MALHRSSLYGYLICLKASSLLYFAHKAANCGLVKTDNSDQMNMMFDSLKV